MEIHSVNAASSQTRAKQSKTKENIKVCKDYCQNILYLSLIFLCSFGIISYPPASNKWTSYVNKMVVLQQKLHNLFVPNLFRFIQTVI